ncbi:CotH kinase family protein [Comamonas composti]|uniref:CotH kinase family protein n=1 Tax=Comamonas composti TaxID=408558 RepID=UPI000478765A|nr:CotH kinase family protein [Comamonas composti]
MSIARTRWVQASLLGACLTLVSCVGGDESLHTDSSVSPGGETPGTGPDPGNPPATGAPFVPSAEDLPRNPDIYVYGNPQSPRLQLLEVDVLYQDTKAPKAPGPYLVDKYSCAELSTPPESYPGGKVTLDTVHLDENADDACQPEIKVKVSSSDGLISAADAKMRLRGASTRKAKLKSYRVKLDKSVQPWYGENTLQFNKHPWDLTRIRNKLAFDLMRQVPYHESLRTQFAHLRYNDGAAISDLGLFTHVEKMGDAYLERRGWIAGSNVYKIESFNFGFGADVQARLKPMPSTDQEVAEFEKVMSIEADSGNHQGIINAAKALNDGSTPFTQVFARHFNRNNYLTWLATAILLGNYDTRTQNFGLYQPLGTEKFYFLPWDYDGALGFAQQPGEDYYTQWSLGIGNWWDSPLHRGFLSQPGNIALLKAAVDEIRSKYLTDAAVKALLDSYRPIVEPFIDRAPDNAGLATNGTDTPAQQWDAEYRRLQTVIGKNHEFFLESLERPMPYWLSAEDKSGQLDLDWSWPQPFHPGNKPLSYKIEIAKAEPGKEPFANLYQPAATLSEPAYKLGSLPAGDYLVRVTASDAAGHWTNGFDSYELDGKPVHGTLCVRMPGAGECD